jgi:hypothetical protein
MRILALAQGQIVKDSLGWSPLTWKIPYQCLLLGPTLPRVFGKLKKLETHPQLINMQTYANFNHNCTFKQIWFVLSINILKRNSNTHMHFEKVVAKVVSINFEHVSNQQHAS